MTSLALTLVPPAHPLIGRVQPPGSKSITNRALLLAGLAHGTSHLRGALKSDDTAYMARALRQMGPPGMSHDELVEPARRRIEFMTAFPHWCGMIGPP